MKYKQIDKIISSLYCAFAWADSKKGWKYWNKVVENLEKMKGGNNQDGKKKI